MSAEPSTPIRPARRSRRTSGERLRLALAELCGGFGEITQHDEKAWASITFSGARHTLRLNFEGADAVKAGENFVAILPEHEFAIPGQLVADATITSVEHALLPEPRMLVECELLLLVDA
ncbi:hypothetical protein QWY75_01795 [Pontixanthobacter aestiaquae]|uniref:Uncharacterized protein n=1 Tax=Pontixanthobacter aestiaquae TaxID=1509367 RepID=A0A844Z827_9SPHN|nr:hypothetical protein [Pontixanthobacter aestiaquae]MDN3644934.1 hypothetical protein [Pontixanthobacter aestiaquae]MXO84065.1 hypothetical protein [Pontixanthobacter aestiaquae]